MGSISGSYAGRRTGAAWCLCAAGISSFWGGPIRIRRPIPAGTEQAIYIVEPGGQPRKIANGHTPSISPNGRRLVYLSGGQLWVAGLDGGGAAMLFHPRSGVTSSEAAWSPDGGRVAFVSDRGNHSFIAVYDFDSKALSYMDPSVDRDSQPVWSPDGKQIAFMRTQSGGGGRGGRRAGDPWAIRVASVADGTSRQIWRADAGPGSVFHPVVAESQLFWGAGDRILFPWEKDGWAHLYSVAVEGGAATLLTPGNFEVEHVAFSDDRREAVFSSNQDDIDRRHIWRVAIAGGKPRGGDQRRVARSGRRCSRDGGVAFLHARCARAGAGGDPDRDGGEGHGAGIHAGGLPRRFAGRAAAGDLSGVGRHADSRAALPAAGLARRGRSDKALVFMHGGSRRQMLLGWHYMDYYNNAYAMNQYLASQGYVVLSINYRSGIGYGLNFREAINYGASGASEYQRRGGRGLVSAHARGRGSGADRAVGRVVRRLSDGDGAGARVGPVRGGRGFPRRARLERADARTADGVSARRQRATMRRGRRSNLRRWRRVRTWRSPVLLIHGDDDRNVDFSQTVDSRRRCGSRACTSSS